MILSDSLSLAQGSFKEGYIVTIENDTIRGTLANRSDSRNYRSCLFKEALSGNKVEYLPGDILGFGYEGFKKFEANIIDSAFVEVLVRGKLSLYRNNIDFFLKKGGEVITLEELEKEIIINGEKRIVEDQKWKRLVDFTIQDCLPNSDEIASRISYNEKSLSDLVESYNACSGEYYTVYKEKRPWTKVSIGVGMGLMDSKLMFRKEVLNFYYLNKDYKSIDPAFGLVLSFGIPRVSDKLFLEMEAYYRKANYSSHFLIDRSMLEEHWTYIDYTNIAIPISLKYILLPMKNYSIFLQGGFNYDYHLSSQTKRTMKSTNGDDINYYEYEDLFEVYKSLFGVWGGIGVKREFKQVELSSSIRFIKNSYYNEYNTGDNRMGFFVVLKRK